MEVRSTSNSTAAALHGGRGNAGRQRWRGPVAGATALVMAIALAAGPQPAYASPSPDAGWLAAWLPELAASTSLTNEPVVEGRVMRQGGKVPAAGAAVYLEAWPPEEVMAEMEVGDPLHLTPIAKTVTGPDGSYVLRIDPTVDTSALWSRAGTMDVGVVASLDSEFVSYSFSIVPSDWADPEDPFVAQVDVGSREITAAMRVDLELGHPDRAQLSGSDEAMLDEQAGDSLVAEDAGTHAQPASWTPGRCPGGTGLKENLGQRRVRIASIHTIGSGRRMKFTYTSGASSTLGVGVSSTGNFGSFSAGGTVSRTRTVTTTYPWYEGTTHRHLETYFSYGKYCVELTTSPPIRFRYEVRAIRHEGGTNGISASSWSSSRCVKFGEAGSGGSQDTTNATTWSAGAQTAGPIGISLSSRTGYTTSAKLEFKFDTPGHLCGENGMPLSGTPRRIMARS